MPLVIPNISTPATGNCYKDEPFRTTPLSKTIKLEYGERALKLSIDEICLIQEGLCLLRKSLEGDQKKTIEALINKVIEQANDIPE